MALGTYNFKRQIQKDLIQITSTDNAQDITFAPPIGSPVTVSGYASKHSLAINEIGFIMVNSKKASVTVMEKVLLNAGYTTRNGDGSLMTFSKHLVTFTDVSGLTMTYIIQDGDRRCNEGLGILMFTLGLYQVPTPNRTIYGWKAYRINVVIVAVVNPMHTQVIGNGDTIAVEYVLNGDGTLTIPYLITNAGIQVLTPFMLNNNPIENMPYDPITGTFNPAPIPRTFRIGNVISFNASLPIYVL